MLFVQQRLYEGLQPDADGYYVIQRKEFLERIPMKPSTFSGQIGNLTDYYMKQWNLAVSFDLKGLGYENLYVDISYSNGKLRFKRNPYTERPELDYIWARKPLYWEERRFVYESVPVSDAVKLLIEQNALV